MGGRIQSCCPPDKCYFVIVSAGLVEWNRSKQQTWCFHTVPMDRSLAMGKQSGSCLLLCDVGNLSLAGRLKTLTKVRQ